MALLDEVVANYQLLTQEWSKKTPNLEKCGELLAKLKVTDPHLSIPLLL